MTRAEHYKIAEQIAKLAFEQVEKLGNELPEELDVLEMRTYLARLQGISTLIEIGQLHATLANCRVKEVDLAELDDQGATAPLSDKINKQDPKHSDGPE